MKNIIEKMNTTKTTKELLDLTDTARYEYMKHYYNNSMAVDEKHEKFKSLEKRIYELAIENATIPEELEACAASIELNFCFDGIDADEWAEQIRIKAYGIEWYLREHFSSSTYQGFVGFTNEERVKNPFEELQLAMNC
jgi:hypothetical protein